MKKGLQFALLGIVGMLIVGAIVFFEAKKIGISGGSVDEAVDIEINTMSREDKAKEYKLAKEIVSPAGFINTDGITIQEFIGKKVVLIDFWTYSCINCQRTLPYLTSWYEKYRGDGLEIIGVHTPEFEFEKKHENVQRAVDEYDIMYPVVLDNDYATWRNYNNRYWPRKYIIDIDGFIVYDHIGEGAYEETEQIIQALLAERKTVLNEESEVPTGVVSPENAEDVDYGSPRSPETYFGSLRNTNFGSGEAGKKGENVFSVPEIPLSDTLYLRGRWDIQEEYARNTEASAAIVYKFQAQKVFLVGRANSPVRARVLIDGEVISPEMEGKDVSDGYVVFSEDRLYRIVEGSDWGEHTLMIIPETGGLEAYAFTFG